MKMGKKEGEGETLDLTPMIDMTFQLIAFFMILMNLSAVDRSEKIDLPLSELAKPPKGEQPKVQMVINLQKDGSLLFGGRSFPTPKALETEFDFKIKDAKREGLEPKDVKVIIRGHKDLESGKIQELMAFCEEKELTSFALRVKERILGAK